MPLLKLNRAFHYPNFYTFLSFNLLSLLQIRWILQKKKKKIPVTAWIKAVSPVLDLDSPTPGLRIAWVA